MEKARTEVLSFIQSQFVYQSVHTKKHQMAGSTRLHTNGMLGPRLVLSMRNARYEWLLSET